MAKYTYRGDPNDHFSGADELTVYNITFKKGESTEVDDNLMIDRPGLGNVSVAAQLAKHSHFTSDAGPETNKDPRAESKERGRHGPKPELQTPEAE